MVGARLADDHTTSNLGLQRVVEEKNISSETHCLVDVSDDTAQPQKTVSEHTTCRQPQRVKNRKRHKAQIISDHFLEHDMSSLFSNSPTVITYSCIREHLDIASGRCSQQICSNSVMQHVNKEENLTLLNATKT